MHRNTDAETVMLGEAQHGRAAAGDHPVCIAEQLGHEDPGFTFRVYQRAVKRRDRLSGAYLDQFDRALEWALMGTSEAPSPSPAGEPTSTAREETAQ
jgi:hypothetical protein